MYKGKRKQYRKFSSIIGIAHTGTRGVMVIIVGNGHGDTSSNPR